MSGSNRTVTKGPLAVTGNKFPVNQYGNSNRTANGSTVTLNSNPPRNTRNVYMNNNSNYVATNRTVLPRVDDTNPAQIEPFNNGNLRRMKECNFHYTTEGTVIKVNLTFGNNRVYGFFGLI